MMDSSKPWWRRRRLWWPLAGALIFLAVLPELIRAALPTVAERQGLGQLQVMDIDLNLFAGTAAVKGLDLLRDGRTVLHFERVAVNMDWWASLTGNGWQVGQLSLQGVDLPVVQRPDDVWEVVIPLESPPVQEPVEEPTAPPQFLLRQLDLLDIDVDVASKLVSGRFHIEDLTLNNLSNWQVDPANFELAGSWHGAELVLDGNLSLAGEQPDADLTLRMQAVPLAWLNPLLSAQGLELAGQLTSELHLVWKKNQGEVTGSIDLADLAVDYGNLGVGLAQVGWNGAVNLVRVDDALRPVMRASVALSDFSLQDQSERQVVTGGSLTLADVSLSQDGQVGIAKAELRDLAVVAGSGADDRLSTAAVDIENLSLVPGDALLVDAASIRGADYLVILQANGELALQSVLTQVLASLPEPDASGPEAETSEPEPAAAAPMRVRIGSLTLGGESHVRWRDETFKSPVKLDLGIDQLTLTEMDSAQADTASALEFKGSLGEFSALTVNGNLKPFAQQLHLDLKGTLKSVSLPQLSPYMERLMGYDLVAGHYDHDFTLDLEGTQLAMQNDLKLRQLQVAKADIDPAEVSTQLPVPLDFALNLLRDRKDNIELDVPIEGDLSKPDIGLDDIIGTALVSALQTGSVSYLALALQPYGAVYMAADYLGGQIGKMRLEPLRMDPAAATFNDENRAYLQKIHGLMTERDALQLKLCGVAVPSDIVTTPEDQAAPDADTAVPAALTEEQRAALLNLAQARSRAAKQYLMELGTGGERLFQCKPRVDEALASGGVDLLL